MVSLWRYPVKSMMGEELNAAEVTELGLLGDRAYALVDGSDGKVASAKNPKKWPRLFDFRAAFAGDPRVGAEMPPVRITMPDGTVITSEHGELNAALSRVLNREVTFKGARRERGESSVSAWTPQAEEYWPDMDGLDYRDTVTDFELPEGTFFDCAVVHLLTTSTLDRLRELYPQGRFEVRRFRPNVIAQTVENVKEFVEDRTLPPLRDDDPSASGSAQGSGHSARGSPEQSRQRRRLCFNRARRHNPPRRCDRIDGLEPAAASALLAEVADHEATPSPRSR